MLLKKCNQLCEQVIGSLTSKKKSVIPAPMKADANKSLTTQAPTYFKKDDEEAQKQGAGDVPGELIEKKAPAVKPEKIHKRKI